MMTTKDEVAELRRLIKRSVPTVSVRRGRGTASGWCDIWGSGEYGFTDEERAGLKALGFSPGGNCDAIPPDALAFWIRKLGGEADPERLPVCIVCRAPAVVDFGCNCDLTHWLCEEHRDIAPKDCAFIVRQAREAAPAPLLCFCGAAARAYPNPFAGYPDHVSVLCDYHVAN